MQKLMSLEDFDRVKSKTKTVAVRKKEKLHRKVKKTGWKYIRDWLEVFWATDKTELQRRWTALDNIIDGCSGYLAGKVTEDQKGARAVCAQTLHNQAILRLYQEQQKARFYGAKVNELPAPVQAGSGRRSAGRAVGVQNAAEHRGVRFERAVQGFGQQGGPGNTVVHGAQLEELGQDTFNILTGDDNMDAYALRALVKKLIKEKQLNRNLGNFKIPYFTDADRVKHALSFSDTQVFFDNKVFSTKNIHSEDGEHQAMYALSQQGAFYARTNIRSFNHSCFTAGESVICAGMMSALNGVMVHISNGSGHYGPGMDELLDACDALANTDYDVPLSACALYLDFANVYGRGAAKKYRIPMHLFVQANGMVNQPADFEVVLDIDTLCLKYVNKPRARGRGAVIPVDFESS